MKKELAQAWSADLRSTKAPQTGGCLYDGEGYCCLGRLCLLMGAEFKQEIDERSDISDEYRYKIYRPFVDGKQAETRCVLPKALAAKAGMKTQTGYLTDTRDPSDSDLNIELSSLNDRGRSFKEIADIIDEHWEAL